MTDPTHQRRRAGNIGLRVALVYMGVAGLWIVFSDRYVERLAPGPALLTELQTYKGWIFVAATGALLAWLVSRFTRAVEAANEALSNRQQDMLRVNRSYRVLSGVNGAVLRIREPELLLREACRIAHDEGRLALVWAGLVDREAGVIRPVAAFGQGPDYGADFTIPLAGDSRWARTAAARAVREGRHVVANDLVDNPDYADWQDVVQAVGCRSLAVFPLGGEQEAAGVIGFYAAEADAFDSSEVKVLGEIAADVALGLDFIAKESRLHYAAYYDPLTGQPNRDLFLDRVAQALARARHDGRCVGVAVFDVCAFRRINDGGGRHVGDEVLKAVAAHLRGCVRDGDTVARLGGDEFGVLFADMARSRDIGVVVESMLSRMPLTVSVEQQALLVSLTGGAAVFPGEGDSAEALLANAELALHSGDGERSLNECVFYTAGLNAQAQEQRRIEQALHGALERDEFTLLYQPVIATANRSIVSVEALLRWHTPDLGSVSPGVFIPMAESSGLIVPIGQWVLETACAQLADWHRCGCQAVHMSVNVGARQLLANDFVAMVRRTVEASEACVGKLAIEVTETDVIRDFDHAVKVLGELRAMGIQVYLDDFGTGYSSLSYLSRLPVDVIKIDRAFVTDINVRRDARALVGAIVAMARSLEMGVVAEGVETSEQLAVLTELGCDLVQGFLFSPARPADTLAESLRHLCSSGSAARAMDRALPR